MKINAFDKSELVEKRLCIGSDRVFFSSCYDGVLFIIDQQVLLFKVFIKSVVRGI